MISRAGLRTSIAAKQPFSRSMHWYTWEGKPRHNASYDTAKDESLLPSVTSVLSVLRHASLETWKCRVVANSCFDEPFDSLQHESKEKYVQQMMNKPDEIARDAARLGTRAHKKCEHINLDLLHEDMKEKFAKRLLAKEKSQSKAKEVPESLKYFEDVYGKWSSRNIQYTTWVEGVVVNPVDGYAGTCDLQFVDKIDGRTWVADIKTQKFRGGKPMFYDTWLLQLSAYYAVLGGDGAASIVLDSNRHSKDVAVHYYTPEELEDAFQTFLACLHVWRRVNNLPYTGHKSSHG